MDAGPRSRGLGPLATGPTDSLKEVGGYLVVSFRSAAHAPQDNVVDRVGIQQLGKLGPGKLLAAEELRSHGPAAMHKDETDRAVRDCGNNPFADSGYVVLSRPKPASKTAVTATAKVGRSTDVAVVPRGNSPWTR